MAEQNDAAQSQKSATKAGIVQPPNRVKPLNWPKQVQGV